MAFSGIVIPATCSNPNEKAQQAFHSFKPNTIRLVRMPRKTRAAIASWRQDVNTYQREKRRTDREARRMKEASRREAAGLPEPDYSHIEIDRSAITTILNRFADYFHGDDEREEAISIIIGQMQGRPGADRAYREWLREMSRRQRGSSHQW